MKAVLQTIAQAILILNIFLFSTLNLSAKNDDSIESQFTGQAIVLTQRKKAVLH